MSSASLQLKRRILKGFGANAYGQLVTIGIQILSVPLFLYFWGAEQYGEWLLLAAIPTYLSLSDIGFSAVAGNKMTMELVRGDKVSALVTYQSSWALITTVSLFVLLFMFLVLFLLPLTDLLNLKVINAHDASIVLLWLGIQVLVSLQGGMLNAGFRSIGQYARGTYITNSIRLFEWAAGVVALLLGASPVSVAVTISLSRIVSTLASLHILQSSSPWLVVGFRHIDVRVISQLFRPALSFMAFPLGQALSIQGVTIAIGASAGSSAVVIFSTYRTISRILVQLVSLVNQALWPEISTAYGANDISLVGQLHRRGFALSFWLGLVSLVIVGFLGGSIIELWTNNSIESKPLLLWLLLMLAFLNVLWQSSWVVLMATNNHVDISFVFLVSSAIALLVCFLLNQFGVESSAVILIVAELPLLIFTIKKSLVLTSDRPFNFLKSIIFISGKY